MKIKINKEPKKKTQAQEDQERYDAGADKKASKLGMTKEDVRSAYQEHKDNDHPNAEATNGGPRNAQKIRKKGSKTHTIAGNPIKGKAQSVAKYEKGTKSIKIKGKNKDC